MRSLYGMLSSFAICLAIGVASQAATYAVNQATGDDTADGSRPAPWKTVSRGVRDLKPGDTLTVGPGVYRETVTVTCRGTAAAPITIQAAPGAPVVITGADVVAGWRKCTQEIAAGHRLAEQIYYADIPWHPTVLYDAKREQALARLPGVNWPGQWAWEKTGEKTARVFYFPAGGAIGDGAVALPRRPCQMVLGGAAHVIVDRFDMGYGAYTHSAASVVLVNPEGAGEGGGQGIVIRNCSMHHHKRFGVLIRKCDKPKLQKCLISENSYGVMLGNNNGALIEQCEIGRNTIDGFRDTYEGRDTVVRRCYIHHHFDSAAHPDNIQLHDNVKNILFDSNLIICGGQSVMMSKTDGVTFRNNVILGSAANMIVCGHNNTINATFERNTFALWAGSMFAFGGGTGYKMSGNILVNQGGVMFYWVPKGATCESDRNLFWVEPGHAASRPRWCGKGVSYIVLADYQKATPWETHSEFKDPKFASAPTYVAKQDWRRRDQCTRERVVVRHPNLFKAGDHVETNFDGIVRTVKAVEGDVVVIDPPMAKQTVFILLCNWKEKTKFTYDYKTPLGKKYGSSISVPGFMKGDFDGDGKRDVPGHR